MHEGYGRTCILLMSRFIGTESYSLEAFCAEQDTPY